MYCWGLTPVYVPDNYHLVVVGDELRNSFWGYQIEFSLILALVCIGTLPKITMLNRRCIERNGSLSIVMFVFSGLYTLIDQVKTHHGKIITDPDFSASVKSLKPFDRNRLS